MNDAEKPKSEIGDIRAAKAKPEADIMRAIDKFCSDYSVNQKDLSIVAALNKTNFGGILRIKINLTI